MTRNGPLIVNKISFTTGNHPQQKHNNIIFVLFTQRKKWQKNLWCFLLHFCFLAPLNKNSPSVDTSTAFVSRANVRLRPPGGKPETVPRWGGFSHKPIVDPKGLISNTAVCVASFIAEGMVRAVRLPTIFQKHGGCSFSIEKVWVLYACEFT